MKRLCGVLLACVAVLAMAGPAGAQVPPLRNPGGAEFTASVDHLQISRYSIGFFLPGTQEPVQEVDLAPTCSGVQPNVVCTAPINTMPLTFGAAYTAKVRAYAGTMASDWSDASNPFDRVPGRPGVTTVKK